MRPIGSIVACVALAALTAGCNLVDGRYLREGIGTDLYWSGLPEATQLQEAYVGYICWQAGLRVRLNGDRYECTYEEASALGPVYWQTFVQAGMNDIDLRCDSYLAWLDDKKRWTGPVLQEISDIRTATTAIMAATGSGVTPLAVVGAAFGLATNTFTNVSHRLLTEVNQSTVQSVVISRRNEYRMGVNTKVIDSRPMAIHALRSYLNICLPFTIETEINTTVTVFERSGAGALQTRPPLSNPETVAGPLTPQRQIAPPDRPPPPSSPAFSEIIENFDPRVHSNAYVIGLQKALCVAQAEWGRIGPQTRTMIQMFEKMRYEGAPDTRGLNGKLDTRERADLNALGPCPAEYRNYFERINFKPPNGPRPSLVKLLNKVPDGGTLSPDTTLSGARDKIVAVRKKLGLVLAIPGLPGQVTPDLLDRLEELPNP